MPMTPLSVVLYLAVIFVGGAVLSVAESFSADEMETRLTIGRATFIIVQVCSAVAGQHIRVLVGQQQETCRCTFRAGASRNLRGQSRRQLSRPLSWFCGSDLMFCEATATSAPPSPFKHCGQRWLQDVVLRSGKQLPLYAKIQCLSHRAAPAVVIPAAPSLDGSHTATLSPGDMWWENFKVQENSVDVDAQEAHIAGGEEVINVLFSSGTVGAPKAIPWTHITPLRCVAC
jgi:acyl-coenzyme A synthetase/AMP-(fatty) acid ligase